MAYDEGLAERVREALQHNLETACVEKRMFGGLAFMYKGHMSVGIIGDRLMVRVGPEGYEQALNHPHAAPMDFTGKPLKGFIYVEAAGIAEDDDLLRWIGQGVEFADSLPPR